MKNNSFGKVLSELRKEKGLKREDLANLLGCSAAAIGNYENDNRSPDFDTLVRIADYFNTTTDYLLGRTETKTVETNIRSVCDYTGLSDKAVEYLNFCSSECMKSRGTETDLFTGFLNYLITTNLEHDGVVTTFSECLLHYFQQLERGSKLNLKYIAENDTDKKHLLVEELIAQSRNIRYSKIDLNELTADYLEDFLDEYIKFYDKTIEQAGKDGETDGND